MSFFSYSLFQLAEMRKLVADAQPGDSFVFSCEFVVFSFLHEGLSGIEFLDLLKFLAAQQTAPTPPAEAAGAGSGGE